MLQNIPFNDEEEVKGAPVDEDAMLALALKKLNWQDNKEGEHMRPLHYLNLINNFTDKMIKKTQFDLQCAQDEVCVVVTYNNLNSVLEISVDNGKFYHSKQGRL